MREQVEERLEYFDTGERGAPNDEVMEDVLKSLKKKQKRKHSEEGSTKKKRKSSEDGSTKKKRKLSEEGSSKKKRKSSEEGSSKKKRKDS